MKSATPFTDANTVTFEGGLPVLNVTDVVKASFAKKLELALRGVVDSCDLVRAQEIASEALRD